jgi:hypothetical protein
MSPMEWCLVLLPLPIGFALLRLILKERREKQPHPQKTS